MYFTEENNFFNFNNYDDIDFNVASINYNNKSKLYNIDEGFNKGNMFRNLYSKYKNHVYVLKINNEKDKLLFDLQSYIFALKDINLYLDVHPDDKEMLKKFSEVLEKLNKLKEQYINKYGPLCINDVKSTNKWTWINNPWPWDKGGN